MTMAGSRNAMSKESGASLPWFAPLADLQCLGGHGEKNNRKGVPLEAGPAERREN